MRGKKDADWPELVQSWKRIQESLRRRMVVRPLRPLPRYVAGADAAFSRDKTTVYAAAVVYDRQDQRIVEVRQAVRPAEVPYVPGFLSFREGPAVADAIRSLQHPFDAILFDAHGYAHPRRCGLATHLAIELGRPGIGVAKSRLLGEFEDPPPNAGASAPLMDASEQIGLVVRTRDRVRPIFVSVGHLVDLSTAAELVRACCTRYRIPEPTRQADIEVARLKRTERRNDE
jgi:deoxyribonuclease V